MRRLRDLLSSLTFTAIAGTAVGLAACEPDELIEAPDDGLAISAGLTALAAGTCPPATSLAPGVLTAAGDEAAASFTRDGRSVYFHRRNTERIEVIMVSHRIRGSGFSEPEVVPFSGGGFRDFDPFITASGNEIFFASRRPAAPGRTDSNIWRVQRLRAGGWSEPSLLGPEVNSSQNDQFASLTDDGLLVLASDRAGGVGGFDLWVSRRDRNGKFSPAQNLGPTINTDQHEFNPWVSPDGRLLLFGNIGRPDSRGGPDLYGSVNAFGDFLTPFNLGDCVNSAAQEFAPTVAFRRGSLVFSRNDGTGTGGDFIEIGLRSPWRE